MASYRPEWLQGIASVLSFLPPGLLLFATALQLRRIPLDRTTMLLREHRVRISRATGTTGAPTTGTCTREGTRYTPRFIKQLSDTIDRTCRRGENPLSSIVTIERILDESREPLQRTHQQLTAIVARTMLAWAFAEGICAIVQSLRSLPASTQTDPWVVWLGAGAAGGIITCGCLLPLTQIKRAALLLDFSQGRTASQWLDGLARKLPDQRLWRAGIELEDANTAWLRDEFHERITPARDALARAERYTVVYEMVALMPATALLVISRA